MNVRTGRTLLVLGLALASISAWAVDSAVNTAIGAATAPAATTKKPATTAPAKTTAASTTTTPATTPSTTPAAVALDGHCKPRKHPGKGWAKGHAKKGC